MYPARIFEVTTLPSGVDLDEGGLLLLEDPIVDEILAPLLLQHPLDGLEVIA